MRTEYAALGITSLKSNSGYVRPAELPDWVYLDSPAIEVMTDFEIVRPVTTSADVSIDDALEHMKKAGVRLLLVIDESDAIIGMITASDIQGERPIRIVEESRISRAEVTVRMIMTPPEAIMTLNLISVRNASVGQVVETLNELERQHILVVMVDEDTKAHQLRGLFSTSQIAKQLHRDVAHHREAADSLAALVSPRS